MFEVNDLYYELNDEPLIKALSFSLSPGHFLQITGDNGKGKTTLLKLLAGILRPTSGEIFWKKQNIQKNDEYFYPEINYIGHKSAVSLLLTPEENLYFFSQAYGLKSSISEALSAVNLSHKRNTVAASLSAGQIRRIALARLFLLDTPLWLLDEPYTALDAQGVVWLKKHIQAHLDQGGMVIMTSHQEHGIKAPYYQEIIL